MSELYESHVTVEHVTEDNFLEICKALSTKPVLVERDTGSGQRQMMTAKFHRCSQEQAMEEMRDLASNFTFVSRMKLEVIVGPSKKPPEPHLYLEFHSKFILPENELGIFEDRVETLGGHTSRNSFKLQASPGHVFHFATARDEVTMRKIVKAAGYELVNTLRECVLYDTNPEIDRFWGGCGGCQIKQFQL
jgi:hypothetical protein